MTAMRRDGCRRVAIANDHEAYVYGLAEELELLKRSYGVRLVSNTRINVGPRSYRTYAVALRAQHVDCFVFAGITANNAVRVTADVAAAIPRAKLYGGDGICASSFTDPALQGIPASLGRRFECTTLTMPIDTHPGGSAFRAAYQAEYAVSNPDPYAIYVYEAMKLGLDTIEFLGPNGNSRAAILKALFMTTNRHSAIGTYSLSRNGDTTLRSDGLYKVTGRRGMLVFVRNANPR